jgi:hypothetical protein
MSAPAANERDWAFGVRVRVLPNQPDVFEMEILTEGGLYIFRTTVGQLDEMIDDLDAS